MKQKTPPFAFPAMLDRMSFIWRWSLMRNNRPENLKEHSFDVAVIAHCLCEIHNFITDARQEHHIYSSDVVVLALYHDAAEIIVGDMPTPVKYNNESIKTAFKELERKAEESLVHMLPEELQPSYRYCMCQKGSPEELAIVKAADKLSAYIHCINEETAGNTEFTSAKETLWQSILKMDLPEVQYFIENFLPAWGLTLDQLTHN